MPGISRPDRGFLERLSRRFRYLYIQTIRTKDSAHRLAAGFALGTFVAFTPTMPLQTILALLFSALFRVNKVTALVSVWSTNVVTAPAVFYFNYRLGTQILGTPVRLRFSELERFLKHIRLTFDADFWARYLDELVGLGWDVLFPLMIGSAIIAVGLGLIAYLLLLPVFRWVVRNRGRIHERLLNDIRRLRRKHA